MTIRTATPDDAGRIAGLLLAAYAPYERVLGRALWRAYRDELTDVEARLATSDQVVFDDPADGLVGCVTFYPDASLDPQGFPAGLASFRLLAVDPVARGRSIGRRLVEECVARAQRAGAPALGLHTARFMTEAVALYEAMGFERAPEHDFDPRDVYGAAAAEGDIRAIAYTLALGR